MPVRLVTAIRHCARCSERLQVLDRVWLLGGGRIRLLDDDETNLHAKWVGRFDQWSGFVISAV